MKKAMLLICGVIFFAGCANRIDPTPGEKCEPKWYKNQEESNEKIVYGYSLEKSRNSSLASKKGIAQAQAMALTQINQYIKDDLIIGIEEMERASGKDYGSDYRDATYNELKVSTEEDCDHCVRDKFEDCEDDGYMVVYTRVKIDVENYINKDLRGKRNKLLEKPEELLDELKNKLD